MIELFVPNTNNLLQNIVGFLNTLATNHKT